MNNKLIKLLSFLLALVILTTALAACGGKVECTNHVDANRDGVCDTEGCGTAVEIPQTDFVAGLKLDRTSETRKLEVTVKMMIDGDTTHFNVPAEAASLFEAGTLKARYLAVNTPESTGKIEEWGKQASNFTKEKLSTATSIIVESDDANWNVDSTGGRHLVWVWYLAPGETEYRNLNLELLQNGLGRASNTAGNRYGSTCMAALNQAKALKLRMHSDERDPLFYYGAVQEVNLKELRLNIADYEGTQVAFDGIISTDGGDQGVYVESYDEETDMYYGIYVYYGNSGTIGDVNAMLKPGNKVRVVGTVSDFNGSWQVSGLQYNPFKVGDPGNMALISEGNSGAYRLTDPVKFTTGKVYIDVTENGEETTKELDYAAAATATSVSFENLYVKRAYTTNNGGNSDGEMTLYCSVGTVEIVIRTGLLFDENNKLVKQDAFVGKTISVKGVVDYFNGYQIKVLSMDNITFN